MLKLPEYRHMVGGRFGQIVL